MLSINWPSVMQKAISFCSLLLTENGYTMQPNSAHAVPLMLKLMYAQNVPKKQGLYFMRRSKTQLLWWEVLQDTPQISSQD